MTLERVFFNSSGKLLWISPGGVDSAYLLYAAVRNGARFSRILQRRTIQPEFELRDARRLAAELKVTPDCAGITIFYLISPGIINPSGPLLSL